VAGAAPGRSRRWSRAGVPLAVVALAAALAGVLLAGEDDSDRPAGPRARAEPAPVAVASDAPRHATLAELVAATDVVVRAEVVATERGRLFGDPASGTAVESRLVTLEVAEVVRGTGIEAGTTVLVEEEGWLPDGAPLVVDGAAPSAVGDDGLWFLVAGGDPAVDAFVVVNAQGRYLLSGPGGGLRGAAGDDPLVAELAALPLPALEARIRAA